MAKEFAEKFYHSREWRAMRQYILKRDRYSCVRCGAPGTEVHHIIRLSPQNINDRSISLNPANLELLCDRCHKEEHEAESHHLTLKQRQLKAIQLDYVFDSDGNLIAPQSLG